MAWSGLHCVDFNHSSPRAVRMSVSIHSPRLCLCQLLADMEPPIFGHTGPLAQIAAGDSC